MSKLYPRLYAALKAEGHPPARATELLLDARRHDEFALIWVRCIASIRRDRRNMLRAAFREIDALWGSL